MRFCHSCILKAFDVKEKENKENKDYDYEFDSHIKCPVCNRLTFRNDLVRDKNTARVINSLTVYCEYSFRN